MKLLQKACLGVMTLIVGFEVVCQIHAFRLEARNDVIRSLDNHLFQRSDEAFLGYELKPAYTYTGPDRHCVINERGIRKTPSTIDTDGVASVAVIGDSVTFGTRFSQNETIPARAQSMLQMQGATVKLLNFGVPGYGLREILANLQVRGAHYDVQHIVFIMNLNDFAWRNTVYEGADNGLNRMYNMPRLKSSLYLRKVVYRLRKGRGRQVAPSWYRWLYDANKYKGYAAIKEMKQYAEKQHASFTVMLLPAGCAYTRGGYQLHDIAKDITEYLEEGGIRTQNLEHALAADPPAYFDQTDHLTASGNEIVASLLVSNVLAAISGSN